MSRDRKRAKSPACVGSQRWPVRTCRRTRLRRFRCVLRTSVQRLPRLRRLSRISSVGVTSGRLIDASARFAPRDGFCGSGVELVQAAADFGRPCLLRVFVDVVLETLNQLPGKRDDSC